MKKCSTCKIEKELEQFSKSSYSCKQCAKERTKKWQKDNVQKVVEHSREWRKVNKGYHLEYPKTKLEPGIYMVKNLITGKRYVGQSATPYKRRGEHLSVVKKIRNTNEWLQDDLKQYGRESFVFGVIEHCEKERLLEREQYYIRQMKPEYNYGK